MNLVVIPAEVLINWSIFEASNDYIDSEYDIRLFFELFRVCWHSFPFK